MSNLAYWYCPHCKEEIDPTNVTFQELHDTCGHAVEWIEGINLDRLREICAAERDGRLVVLPCKVGDTVYYIRRNVCKHADATGYCDVDRWYAKKGVKAESGCKDCPHQIPETRIISAPFRLALLDEKKCGHLHVSEIFLTREEAEAALQKEAEHE